MARADYISIDDIERCFSYMTPTNVLVCRVCISTGLRIGDVVSIRTRDLKQRLYIREEKTGKVRRCYLRKSLLHDLKAQAGAVFVFEHRLDKFRHRTRQSVWKDLKKASLFAGISGQLSPHSLRKLYAVRLFRRYGSIERVRKILCHDSDFVTLLYAFSDIISEQNKARS